MRAVHDGFSVEATPLRPTKSRSLKTTPQQEEQKQQQQQEVAAASSSSFADNPSGFETIPIGGTASNAARPSNHHREGGMAATRPQSTESMRSSPMGAAANGGLRQKGAGGDSSASSPRGGGDASAVGRPPLRRKGTAVGVSVVTRPPLAAAGRSSSNSRVGGGDGGRKGSSSASSAAHLSLNNTATGAVHGGAAGGATPVGVGSSSENEYDVEAPIRSDGGDDFDDEDDDDMAETAAGGSDNGEHHTADGNGRDNRSDCGGMYDSSDDDESVRQRHRALYRRQHDEQQRRRSMLRLLTPQQQRDREALEARRRRAARAEAKAASSEGGGTSAAGTPLAAGRGLVPPPLHSHSHSQRRGSGEFDDEDLVQLAIASGAVTPTPSNQFFIDGASTVSGGGGGGGSALSPLDVSAVSSATLPSGGRYGQNRQRAATAPGREKGGGGGRSLAAVEESEFGYGPLSPPSVAEGGSNLVFDTSVAGTLPRNAFSPPKIITMLFSFASVMALPCVAAMRRLGYRVLYERFHTVIDKSSCLTKTAYTQVVRALVPDTPLHDSDKLFASFERTGRGDIDVNVFLMGLQMLLGCATPGDALRYCIRSTDPRSGTPRYITRFEVQSILRCVQIQHSLLLATNAAKGAEALVGASGGNAGGGGSGAGGSSPSSAAEVGGRRPSVGAGVMHFLPSATPSAAAALRPSTSPAAGSGADRHFRAGGGASASSPPSPLGGGLEGDSLFGAGPRLPESTRRAVFAANIAAVAKGFGDSSDNHYFGAHTVLHPNVLNGTDGGGGGGPHARGGSARPGRSGSVSSCRSVESGGGVSPSRQHSATPGGARRGLLPPAPRPGTSSSVSRAKGGASPAPRPHSRGAAAPLPLASSTSASAAQSSSSIGGGGLASGNSSAYLRRISSSAHGGGMGGANSGGGGGGNSTNLHNTTITIGGSVGSGVAIDREFTIMHGAIIDLFEDTTRYDYLGRMALKEFVDYISAKLAASARGGGGVAAAAARRASSALGGGAGAASVLDGGPLVAPAHRLNSKQLVLQHVHQTFVDTRGVNVTK